MGSVIQLKKQINNSYLDLRNSVEEKLVLVDERIVSKLSSNVDLVHKMTKYHLETGGKKFLPFQNRIKKHCWIFNILELIKFSNLCQKSKLLFISLMQMS